MRPVRFGLALEEGVRSLFYCWVREAVEGGERFRAEDPCKYWRFSWEEDKYTFFRESRLVKPRGIVTVSLRSRGVYRYGFFQLHARLPEWEDGPMLWFGFEAEDLFGGGVAHFMFHSGELYAYTGAWGGLLRMKLPGFPEDYGSRRHTYTVKVYRSLALWFIDSSLRGAAVLADSGEPRLVHEGPPYSIGISPMKPASTLGVLLDIDGGDVSREWVWSDLHPWQVRVLEGDPSPSLLLELYEYGSGRRLRGVESEKPVVSHPLPSLEVEVDVLFKASGRGVLRVQSFTLSGEWEDVEVLRVPANEPILYRVGGRTPLVRVVYEPGERCRVEEAEAYLH
ncbi:MAG: hypothetical protein DRJ43_06475 [Thermoprotei archaeon]|nr:MAG: hypothetical protein DRJ43_06475 [Thermoprotei archaeon]